MNKFKLCVIALYSSSVFASTAIVQESFKKYLSIFDHQKTELIEEVISEQYLKELGGKFKLAKGIQSLKKMDNAYKFEIQATHKKNVFKARYIHKLETSKWFLFKKFQNKFKLIGVYEE